MVGIHLNCIFLPFIYLDTWGPKLPISPDTLMRRAFTYGQKTLLEEPNYVLVHKKIYLQIDVLCQLKYYLQIFICVQVDYKLCEET